MAIYNAVTDSWKGQLNFERSCASVGPRDRCGLIEDLTAWNRVLHGLGYELVEALPGKFSLRYVLDYLAHVQTADTCLEKDFLISWLLEHHRCIDDLRVMCADSFPMPPEGKNNGRSIRCLQVAVSKACTHLCYLPPYVNALRCIEHLKISSCHVISESVLVRILQCNSNSLRSVEMTELQLSRRVMRALQCLDKCESLTLWVRTDRYDRDTFRAALSRMVRSRVRFQSIGLDRNVSAMADTLKTNATLTTLDLEMRGSINSPKYLFAALEVNSTLRSLRIGFTFIDPSCGEALALAVSKNTSLLHLELAAHVDNHCMISMAEALSQNTKLEKLRFSGAVEGFDGVLALCDALRTNKTLKRLEFPEFRASRIQRAALAEKLNYVRGYSRVVLPLAEPDLPPLSTFLACPTSCPEELGEINFSGVSHVNVKPFLNALASSNRVRTLSVVADATSEAKLGALCRMLRANHSIRTFKITLNSVQERSVQELLNVLEANETIRELEITSFELGAQIASSLSDFFARNRRITKFKLSVIGLGLSWFIEKLSQGIVMNPVILEFQIDEVSTDVSTRCLISERLIRNRLALNRAVDFVVLHCKDRLCVEAFELFSGKHCLLAQVIETSGKTEPEALRAIASAEYFLLDNYLVITGIVRRSVACDPGDGRMQCDRLNTDCWRAIVRHLRISDVLA